MKSGRPGFSPGCNPSDKVDFSNLTSLKHGFLSCEMGTIMPTAVGGDGEPIQKSTGSMRAITGPIMDSSESQCLQRGLAMAPTGSEILKGSGGSFPWSLRVTEAIGIGNEARREKLFNIRKGLVSDPVPTHPGSQQT